MKVFYTIYRDFNPIILIFFGTLVLFSCSETPEPDKPQMQNPPPKEDPKEDADDNPGEAIITYEQIAGKWLIAEVSLANLRKAGARINTSKKAGTRSTVLRSKSSLGKNLRIVEEEDNPAFIEFLADSTYLFFEGGSLGELIRGKVVASGSNNLELKGLGIIEDFDFREDKFVFKLTGDNGSSAIPVEATKVPPLELDERTRLLCKDWYVEESHGLDEDGTYCDFDCLIGKEIYEYDPWGEIIGIKGVLEHYVLAFTPSGTAFWYTVISGKVFTEEPFTWSWPGAGADEIASYDGERIGIELTQGNLKLNGNDEDGEYGMTFKAGPPYLED